MKPKHDITNGWLRCGAFRVELATVKRYWQQGHKVVLAGEQWSHTIDLDPAPNFLSARLAEAKTDETKAAAVDAKGAMIEQATTDAASLVASLDGHFGGKTETP